MVVDDGSSRAAQASPVMLRAYGFLVAADSPFDSNKINTKEPQTLNPKP